MDLSKLPKLQPAYVRREDEPGYEVALWRPEWRCHCCHDTGEVVSSFASLVIEGFDSTRCLLPLCQKSGCAAGVALANHPTLKNMLDDRFTPAICNEFHKHSYEWWMNFTKEQQEEAVKEFNKKQQELADKRTMPGARGRTENDNREIAIRAEQAQWDLDNPATKAKSTDKEFGF